MSMTSAIMSKMHYAITEKLPYHKNSTDNNERNIQQFSRSPEDIFPSGKYV
jgi:hypothetical protein